MPVVVPPVAKLRNKLGGVDTAHESSSWLVLCRSSPKTSYVREHCVCISIDTENFETTKTHTHTRYNRNAVDLKCIAVSMQPAIS